jgi:hypothetical protein
VVVAAGTPEDVAKVQGAPHGAVPARAAGAAERGEGEAAGGGLKHARTRKELIERYVRAAWILKVRLISARRQLWANQASPIHLESALLQMRKVCEGIAQMCVIASEVESETYDPRLRKNYKVGAVFKLLSRKKSLHFPGRARLTKRDNTEGPAVWDLVTTAATREDIDRVSKIHSRCGTALHEFHREVCP